MGIGERGGERDGEGVIQQCIVIITYSTTRLGKRYNLKSQNVAFTYTELHNQTILLQLNDNNRTPTGVVTNMIDISRHI